MLLLILGIAVAEKPTTSSGYREAFAQFKTDLCVDNNGEVAELTIKEVDKLYQDNNVKFGMDLSLLKYISNQNVSVGSLLPSSAIAGAFFVVLVIVIVFIQLVLGILNICCCNRKANPNEKQASFCMKLMVVFTVLYTVTFILVLIYVGFLLKNVTAIFCSFS
jgi:hypothetical protein